MACCVIDELIARTLSTRSFQEKCAIIETGRPTPALPYLKTKTKTCTRHFSTELYVSVPWLTGCKQANKLFCWPCILFSSVKCSWERIGFSDLNNLSKSSKRHELTQSHLCATINLKSFRSTQCDCRLNQLHRLEIIRHNEEVEENRIALRSFIRVTCHLGMYEQAFRGHDQFMSENRVNYVDAIKMLSKFDDSLAKHLDETTVYIALTNNLQKDLIFAVGEVVLNAIKEEIKNVSFVAISLDETRDVDNKSLLSTVFRYVNSSGGIQERCVDITDVSGDRGAASLANHVFRSLKEFDCQEKLIAQTYDGASVMAGHLTGLQSIVKEQCHEALFVHGCAPRLNLVLSQAVSNIPECNIFFETLRGFSTFFGRCSSRTEKLHREVKMRFPSVAPAQWSNYNGRLVHTLYENREDVLKLFQGILNKPDDWDVETYNLSLGFEVFLREFDTIFMLVIFSDYFSLTDALFEILQSKNSNITRCLTKVSALKNTLRLKKTTQFEVYWERAKEIANNNEPTRRRLRISDLDDVKTNYQQLFSKITDNIIDQITRRFDDLGRLQFLELINPNKSVKYSAKFPKDAFEVLKANYGRFFDFTRLYSELTAMYCLEDLKSKDVLQLSQFLRSCQLDETFPQLWLLCELVLTIPATVVPGQRSFSALKRIKPFARNSTGQGRLKELALMSIEKTLLNSMLNENKAPFYESVIEIFVQKTRRKEFILK